MLQVIGSCDGRIFGLSPQERLKRQIGERSDVAIVAHASAVLGNATVTWLIENRGTLIKTAQGRPLAIAVAPEEEAAAVAAIEGTGPGGFTAVDCTSIDQFVKKLRRRSPLLAHSLEEDRRFRIERALFADVYKGVTDVITKWLWPEPAFWVTKAAARIGISPNMVTSLAIMLTFVAAGLFYAAELAAGLAAAWLMTFLDTVDGKLARVTVTSSRSGDLLDHVTDYIHPPIWWACLAVGLFGIAPDEGATIWASCAVILVTYLAGRAIEEGFKKVFRMNQYLWKPFDSAFRLVVSRRNIILLIMTVGLALGRPIEAFVVCAGWSIVSVAIQLVRLLQALGARKQAPVRSWLM